MISPTHELFDLIFSLPHLERGMSKWLVAASMVPPWGTSQPVTPAAGSWSGSNISNNPLDGISWKDNSTPPRNHHCTIDPHPLVFRQWKQLLIEKHGWWCILVVVAGNKRTSYGSGRAVVVLAVLIPCALFYLYFNYLFSHRRLLVLMSPFKQQEPYQFLPPCSLFLPCRWDSESST